MTIHASSEQIATEQVRVEEQQRVFGVIPNFYVDDPNPAPLTTRLKFSLALKVSRDPVTFLGAALIAGVDQAAGTPDFVQGAKGYGQRFGANYANGLTDIMIGGAILGWTWPMACSRNSYCADSHPSQGIETGDRSHT